MYWGMSPSRISRAAVYGAFPPVGVGLVPVAGFGEAKPLVTAAAVEMSSQYCSQRSLSRISAAATNLRIAASPSLKLPFWRSFPRAEIPLTRKPLPRVAAPDTTPRFKNERRFEPRVNTLCVVIAFFSCDSNQWCRFEFLASTPKNHARDF